MGVKIVNDRVEVEFHNHIFDGLVRDELDLRPDLITRGEHRRLRARGVKEINRCDLYF